MTIVLVGKGLVLGGWPSKIDVFGAPDTSTHRLPFRWEDFCLFVLLLKSKKSSIWTGFAGFTSLFSTSPWQGFQMIFFIHMFFSDVEEGHIYIYEILHIFYTYIYICIYIYIYIENPVWTVTCKREQSSSISGKKTAKICPALPPKKVLFCPLPQEQLQKLCSKEGKAEYQVGHQSRSRWYGENGPELVWFNCWWLTSCTSWDGQYPSIYMVLYIPSGAGFLNHQQ